MILFSKLYTDVIKLNKQYRNSKANCIVATLHKAQTNYKYGTQLCVLAIKPPGFSIHQGQFLIAKITAYLQPKTFTKCAVIRFEQETLAFFILQSLKFILGRRHNTIG